MHKRINISMNESLYETIKQYCKDNELTFSGLLDLLCRNKVGANTTKDNYIEKRKENYHLQVKYILEGGFTEEGLIKAIYVMGNLKTKEIIKQNFLHHVEDLIELGG